MTFLQTHYSTHLSLKDLWSAKRDKSKLVSVFVGDAWSTHEASHGVRLLNGVDVDSFHSDDGFHMSFQRVQLSQPVASQRNDGVSESNAW